MGYSKKVKKKYCKLYRKTHYYIPIYGRNINIIFNEKDFLHILKKYQDFIPDRALGNGESFYNPVNKELAIGIFDNSLATLSHELVHTTQDILLSCHIDPMDSDGETMAYLTAHLFELIEKRMSKQ